SRLGLVGDAGRLAAQIAQVIELGAAHLAAADQLDRVDHRRQHGEHALHALAIGDLAHREALVDAAAGAADAHAFIGLHAGAIAFDHLDVDDHGVARRETRNLLAAGELVDLLFLERRNGVHWKSPAAARPANWGARALSCRHFAELAARIRHGIRFVTRLSCFLAPFAVWPINPAAAPS